MNWCTMISKKDVEHIANLARIELSQTEKEKFTQDLGNILGFVEKLQEVDMKNVKPLAGGTALQNIMRADEVVDKDLEEKSAELVRALPDQENGWAKVKAVFD